MAALMGEVVERVRTMPSYRRDKAVSKSLDVVSRGEETVCRGRVAYVEIADDLTGEERSDMAAMRREYREHPENFIDLGGLMAENGITEEDLEKLPPVKLVYNI